MDTPLSESSISFKLEEIRRRCGELLDEPEGLADLQLEDGSSNPETNDPYNRG